jgi:hypothetical protein
LLLRPYAWRRGQACATCGLSDLSICEHKHFTALCPPPREAALQQAGRHIVARHLLRCCWICTCCYNLADHDDKHARGPPQRRRLRGRLVECWDKVRVQAIEQQHSSTAAHSTAGAWGAKQQRRLLSLPLGVRHSSSCPSASTLTCSPSQVPSRLASNATHNHPRPHPRLHRPRCSSARSQRPLRIARSLHYPHRTAAQRLAPAVRAPPAVVHACAPPSPTTRGANRLRLSARILLPHPRGHCAGSSPAPLAREIATQGTAENRYPKAIVRHQEPGKGATGWDAGSLVCNNLHVQWILVQSTQQH